MSLIRSNLHSHTPLCDGKSDPYEMVREARSKGFSSFGFSSHAPVLFPLDWTLSNETLDVYFRLMNELNEAHGHLIQFYSGLEIDYLHEGMGSSSEPFASLPLDFTIGSVHYVSGRKSDFPGGDSITVNPPLIESYGDEFVAFSIEGSSEEMQAIINQVYGGDKRLIVEDYYRNMRDMLTIHKPDILGHFDLVKKNNKALNLFNEDDEWYMSSVLSVLDVLKKTGVILEINLGGMARGKVSEPYPSSWIIKEAISRDIPLTLSADIHQAGKLEFGYENMEKSLREWGCLYLWYLMDEEFQAFGL